MRILLRACIDQTQKTSHFFLATGVTVGRASHSLARSSMQLQLLAIVLCGVTATILCVQLLGPLVQAPAPLGARADRGAPATIAPRARRHSSTPQPPLVVQIVTLAGGVGTYKVNCLLPQFLFWLGLTSKPGRPHYHITFLTDGDLPLTPIPDTSYTQLNLSDLTNSMHMTFPQKGSHYSHHFAMFKLELHNILKTLDRVLFIDLDCAIVTDLSELYQNMSRWNASQYLGMTQEASNWYEHHPQRHILSGVNSGVMAMDLRKMRADNFTDKWRAAANGTLLETADQDIFNVAVANHPEIFVELPACYNVRPAAEKQCTGTPLIVHGNSHRGEWLTWKLNQMFNQSRSDNCW
jgi:hypothetical protein